MPHHAPKRDEYAYFAQLQTRWQDNDVYGHVNNVVYYALFDSLVNRMLVENGLLDIADGAEIGLVVESQCQYYAPLAFPQPLEGGLRIGHVGNSSVRYELAIFAEDVDVASASGHFVHVFVGRDNRRPVSLSPKYREIFSGLMGKDHRAG